MIGALGSRRTSPALRLAVTSRPSELPACGMKTEICRRVFGIGWSRMLPRTTRPPALIGTRSVVVLLPTSTRRVAEARP